MRKSNKNVPVISVARAWTRGLKGRTERGPCLSSFYRACEKQGFRWTPIARKGVLSAEDKKARVKFAREMLTKGPGFWKRVCFFLDCASFLYKKNPEDEAKTPRGRVWMKKEERLEMSGKGKNIGVGGKLLHLCVAISYGRGVVICHPYDKMTGPNFSRIVEKFFRRCAFRRSRHFVQDNDPAQNSRLAKEAR